VKGRQTNVTVRRGPIPGRGAALSRRCDDRVAQNPTLVLPDVPRLSGHFRHNLGDWRSSVVPCALFRPQAAAAASRADWQVYGSSYWSAHRKIPLLVTVASAVGPPPDSVDHGRDTRVGGAAHLVLDREQVPAVSEIDDGRESGIGTGVLLGNQAALLEPAVGTRKIRDVHLHVVAVVIRQCASVSGIVDTGLPIFARAMVPSPLFSRTGFAMISEIER